MRDRFERAWSSIHAAKREDDDVMYSAVPKLTCMTMTRVQGDDDAEYNVEGMMDWTGFRIFIPTGKV